MPSSIEATNKGNLIYCQVELMKLSHARDGVNIDCELILTSQSF